MSCNPLGFKVRAVAGVEGCLLGWEFGTDICRDTSGLSGITLSLPQGDITPEVGYTRENISSRPDFSRFRHTCTRLDGVGERGEEYYHILSRK